MLTRWGEELIEGDGAAVPLPQYPRPQMTRAQWTNLNGTWQYAIKEMASSGDHPQTVDDPTTPPAKWDGLIRVPFSPEYSLSGVERGVDPDQTLWYRREFQADPQEGQRTLLHFGAVDQSCRVAINGVEAGGNSGGFLPFTIDITELLVTGTNVLVVSVRDVTNSAWMSVGKQSLKRGGIWYTPQSGIWQTVWIEQVPEVHVESVRFTPALDSVDIRIESQAEINADVTIFLGDAEEMRWTVPTNCTTTLQIEQPHLWSPEDPYLYAVDIKLGNDHVHCYFAMRTLGIGQRADGKPALLLNGRPYFAAGLLDQGYWPDGGYTAASDDALIYDIVTAKSLGYNMLRKHIKIEPLRWYHHCDRLGMLVWQDCVNGGRPPRRLLTDSRVVLPYWLPDRPGPVLGRQDSEGLAVFEMEMERTVELLSSVPSVVAWVPFNEGWGQFDAERICERVRELDPSRPIDHASGWFDQGSGDMHSVHLYFRAPAMVGRLPGDKRALVLSEYGGFSTQVPGHEWGKRTFGYSNYGSQETLISAFTKLHRISLPPVIRRGLCATVYTQLSDVEDEANGLLTYDRKVVKLPAALVQDLNASLKEAFHDCDR